MKRVIINTGRYNSPWDDEYYDEGDDPEYTQDDLPIRGKKRTQKSKGFGDRTKPLYRFLESKVGQNWDKIWSEICANNDERSVDGHHLRRHVLGFVDLKVVRDEKTGRLAPLSQKRWYGGTLRNYGFFVDPNNQLRSWEEYNRKAIKKKKQRLRQRKADGERSAKTINGEHYRKINGCWFHFWTEVGYETRWDVRTQQLKKMKVTFNKKRQLNSNELRDLKLKNDNSK